MLEDIINVNLKKCNLNKAFNKSQYSDFTYKIHTWETLSSIIKHVLSDTHNAL